MSGQALKRTKELVRLAQGGDNSALGQLCGVYAERVRRIVRLRMGPELRSQFESMDLVQEAFIEAVKDLGGFTIFNYAATEAHEVLPLLGKGMTRPNLLQK